jgi:hypothetical protein
MGPMDVHALMLRVADANSEIDRAVQSNALTPVAAQALLRILEESMHQLLPLAFSGLEIDDAVPD